MAGAPVLTGAAQLTVSPMAPRWAPLLTAAWGEAEVLDTTAFSQTAGPQGSLGISEFTV